jgi:fructose-1-phosphate kinase PfkB-like protein
MTALRKVGTEVDHSKYKDIVTASGSVPAQAPKDVSSTLSGLENNK